MIETDCLFRIHYYENKKYYSTLFRKPVQNLQNMKSFSFHGDESR